ncbi:MAG TPA: hypothetical protein VGF62_00900 [Rhizomicrobium sp.]|jgi:hypothetical protein
MTKLSRDFAVTALAGLLGAGALAVTTPAAAQMVRGHVAFGHPRTHSRVVFRDGFRRPFARDRFRIGVGFYGGYPTYGYPYDYDYDYGYPAYSGYGATCDPYSSYYDPDDCD